VYARLTVNAGSRQTRSEKAMSTDRPDEVTETADDEKTTSLDETASIAYCAADDEGDADHCVSPEVRQALELDVLEIQIGLDLVSYATELADRIKLLRRELAGSLGLILPAMHICDNLSLEDDEYVIILRGEPLGGGRTKPTMMLALDPGTVSEPIAGATTIEPAFGLPAVWIPAQQQEQAENSGYMVVGVPALVSTHLMDLVKDHAHEIIGLRETRLLLELFAQRQSELVDEVWEILSLRDVMRVLRQLLSEHVPIRDLYTILDTLVEYGATENEPEQLVEIVRERLFRTITRLHVSPDGALDALLFGSNAETLYREIHSEPWTEEKQQALRQLLTELHDAVMAMQQQGLAPVLYTPRDIRRTVRTGLEVSLPHLAVVSAAEIDPAVSVRCFAKLDVEDQSAP